MGEAVELRGDLFSLRIWHTKENTHGQLIFHREDEALEAGEVEGETLVGHLGSMHLINSAGIGGTKPPKEFTLTLQAVFKESIKYPKTDEDNGRRQFSFSLKEMPNAGDLAKLYTHIGKSMAIVFTKAKDQTKDMTE